MEDNVLGFVFFLNLKTVKTLQDSPGLFALIEGPQRGHRNRKSLAAVGKGKSST